MLVGNREWMRRNGIDVPNRVDKGMTKLEEEGQTVVLCAVDGKPKRLNYFYLNEMILSWTHD